MTICKLSLSLSAINISFVILLQIQEFLLHYVHTYMYRKNKLSKEESYQRYVYQQEYEFRKQEHNDTI
jgi:hypothetical protein